MERRIRSNKEETHILIMLIKTPYPMALCTLYNALPLCIDLFFPCNQGHEVYRSTQEVISQSHAPKR